MKAVLQRVESASVTVAGDVIGKIGPGLLVFVCAEHQDNFDTVAYFARKVSRMRVFPDKDGKTNLSLLDNGGSALIVSQFTLAAEWKKGNRPGFSAAADPDVAETLYLEFCEAIRTEGVPVETGQFAAEMKVALVNDGPFTIIMDSKA